MIAGALLSVAVVCIFGAILGAAVGIHVPGINRTRLEDLVWTEFAIGSAAFVLWLLLQVAS